MKRSNVLIAATGTAFCLAAALCASGSARAETEFCPARIQSISNVSGTPNAVAVRLTALGPRNVTGQFVLESDRGWFRAPFPPVAITVQNQHVQSQAIEISIPRQTVLRNVWLSQAASDDPQWGPRHMVSCPPEPERRSAEGVPIRAGIVKTVAALPIPPPFSYSCKTPFETSKVERDEMDGDPYGPGEYATARVDLDETGHVIDVTSLNASNGNFDLRKDLERRVRHMRFTAAVAYCKPVPSTYVLTEGMGP